MLSQRLSIAHLPPLSLPFAICSFIGPLPVPVNHGRFVTPLTTHTITALFARLNLSAFSEASPKIALSDSAAAALAAWRGGSTPAANGGGGGSSASGSKKKLSTAQGNNLTKYWGTPLSSKKPLHVSGKGEARGGGGGSSGSGGGVDDYAGARGGLGSGATSGGGVGCGRGTPVRGAGTREDVFAVPGVSKNALDSVSRDHEMTGCFLFLLVWGIAHYVGAKRCFWDRALFWTRTYFMAKRSILGSGVV